MLSEEQNKRIDYINKMMQWLPKPFTANELEHFKLSQQKEKERIRKELDGD